MKIPRPAVALCSFAERTRNDRSRRPVNRAKGGASAAQGSSNILPYGLPIVLPIAGIHRSEVLPYAQGPFRRKDMWVVPNPLFLQRN